MIIGYVVNIQDSVNYDINLFLRSDLRKKYSNVITNKYTYEDQNGNERVGSTYRCRLKGVNLLTNNDRNPENEMSKKEDSNKKTNNYRNQLKGIRRTSNPIIRDAHVEIIRKIDRSNGWVLCEIFDIDIYQRILIRIYDPITKENLTEFLFDSPYNSHFHLFGASPV